MKKIAGVISVLLCLHGIYAAIERDSCSFCTLSPDNKYLAAVISGKGTTPVIKFWAVKNGELIKEIDDPQIRSFYEIETIEQQWSVAQLKRQYNSSLYLPDKTLLRQKLNEWAEEFEADNRGGTV
jgi:hypothetical protein